MLAKISSVSYITLVFRELNLDRDATWAYPSQVERKQNCGFCENVPSFGFFGVHRSVSEKD